MANANFAGTYCLTGSNQESVQVTLNDSGYVIDCDDWESLIGTPSVNYPHRGVIAMFFTKLIANEKFFEGARRIM